MGGRRRRGARGARRAGRGPPLGRVATDFTDLAALERSTRALRRLGYRGRACIHPAQVGVVNDVFTPTTQEIERAQRVIDLAQQADGAAATDGAGAMIDEAVVRSARRVLALSLALRERRPTVS